MTEDYSQTQDNRSRGDENHCRTNGHTPFLAIYQRFIPPNPQTPEEKRGQLRLSLLEINVGEKQEGHKKLPEVTEQTLIPPLFPNQDLAGYEKVDSRVRMCGHCNDPCSDYCRNLLLAVEEAKLHGNSCDLITLQCTKRMYRPLSDPNGDNLTTTYYREKR